MNLFGAFDFLDKGGWVAWTLAGLSLFMWYALGYRYLFLQSKYLKVRPSTLLENKEIDQGDLLGDFVLKVKRHIKESAQDIETALEFELKSLMQKTMTHRQIVKSIVMVAPLLGLLGTVIGMIETFDSLQDSALFSQSGGIAGGISQALITTQMGLVVAVPGLLLGKKLENREQEISGFSEQVAGLIMLDEVES